MRLLGVELRRLRARAAVLVVMAIGLAGTLLLGWAAHQAAQPMPEEDIAQAERFYQEEVEHWESDGERMVAECLEAEAAESEASGEQLDFGCDEMGPPQREWYVWEPPAFAEFATAALPSAMLLLAFVSLLAGVTFVAAEFATGSIGTWLTFVPRRGRVFASKTGAAAVGGLVFAAVWSAAYLGATALGYALAGSEVAVTATQVHALLKVAVLGTAVTVVGTALGFLLRHTAAALGVALGYVIAVDGIVLSALRGGGRWSLLTNMQAWVTGSASYYQDECTTTATGTMCDWVEHTVSMTQGGLVLLGVVVVLGAAALLTFRRRDV